jgi:aryl-alcohol dehydrogenase-like predicted oxidoreductase
MQQRQIGKGGKSVGAVGLGCMSFAGMYGATDMAESHATLARALELGVTHLDTALIYGNGVSEQVIGAFIKDHPGRFTIATKGGIRTAPSREFDNSEAYLRECVEGSLRRLGVDHVELYYIHRRDQRIPIEDVTGTLARFVEEGKIGGIGYSEIAPSSLRRAAAVHPVMAVQSEYSLWTRLPELGMLRTCEQLGTAFVAFSPVARGMFGLKLPQPASFAKEAFRAGNPRFVEPNYSANAEYFTQFQKYAAEKELSPATLAIAWVLHQGDHIIPIPGTRSAAHLDEDAAAAGVKLSAQDISEIEAILPAGFAHGARYSETQRNGPEDYC